jgi:hypothetical protein
MKLEEVNHIQDRTDSGLGIKVLVEGISPRVEYVLLASSPTFPLMKKLKALLQYMAWMGTVKTLGQPQTEYSGLKTFCPRICLTLELLHTATMDLVVVEGTSQRRHCMATRRTLFHVLPCLGTIQLLRSVSFSFCGIFIKL